MVFKCISNHNVHTYEPSYLYAACNSILPFTKRFNRNNYVITNKSLMGQDQKTRSCLFLADAFKSLNYITNDYIDHLKQTDSVFLKKYTNVLIDEFHLQVILNMCSSIFKSNNKNSFFDLFDYGFPHTDRLRKIGECFNLFLYIFKKIRKENYNYNFNLTDLKNSYYIEFDHSKSIGFLYKILNNYDFYTDEI